MTFLEMIAYIALRSCMACNGCLCFAIATKLLVCCSAPVSSPVKEPRSYIHPKMQLGDKIMYHNGLAELKFVGTTEFAPGVWLGVEFEDDGHGKHDGTVKGVQYFRTHHHGRGLFIKPEKATCHGIPCSELI
eukprot:TRINITY_DN6440_c0_g1_i2.p2 TRINITY_DN6440_c0_g1~~TRINITY_DN6440_c0_g1_i2.p2  ORF type:complete len:132 (+),score=14.49 TRINITY_DN6440_c0_g1_i2:1169-1564(+)